jgi:signal transduction histidine kinase
MEADGTGTAMLIFDDFDKAETIQERLIILRKLASIGRLAANVVHELNNPVDGILRYSRLLLNGMSKDDSNRIYVEHIVGGLVRITNMIRGTLDFTRRSRIMYSPTDIPKCIEGILSSFSDPILSQNIEVETEFDKNIPVVLNVDIEQIFASIIRNAIEAMPKGGRLSITASMISQQLMEVRLSDTGMGIPDEIKSVIFEPFFTDKDLDQAVGLGLFISREIAESYNGSIDVEGELGKGTTFVIRLPVNEDGLTEVFRSHVIKS